MSERRLVALGEEQAKRFEAMADDPNLATRDCEAAGDAWSAWHTGITEEEAEAALNQRYGVPPEAASQDSLYEKLTRFTEVRSPGGENERP